MRTMGHREPCSVDAAAITPGRSDSTRMMQATHLEGPKNPNVVFCQFWRAEVRRMRSSPYFSSSLRFP